MISKREENILLSNAFTDGNIKESKEMVIPKVRIVDWSSLKKRQDSGKKRKNVSKRKKKQHKGYRDGNEHSICGGTVKTPD